VSRSSRRGRRAGLIGAAVLAAGLAGLLGSAAPGLAQTGSFLGYDGHAWRGLSEGEKLAVLTGFLIGAAFEQGMAQSPPPDGVPPETLERMRREGQLRFPFAPAVYKARLEDFYFYQDRRGVPLHRALFLINEQIRQGASGGR